MSWLSTAENVAFFGAMLAVNLAPGPNMLFAFASGVAGGRNAGVRAAFGAALGLVVHMSVATVVTVTIVQLELRVLNALRWFGTGYLIWLGIRAIRMSARNSDPARPQGPVGSVFLRGAVTSLTNPKPALFFAAFLPQFVDPAAGSVPLQMLTLGAIFTASATAVNSSVGWAGGILEDLLRPPSSVRAMAGAHRGRRHAVPGLGSPHRGNAAIEVWRLTAIVRGFRRRIRDETSHCRDIRIRGWRDAGTRRAPRKIAARSLARFKRVNSAP